MEKWSLFKYLAILTPLSQATHAWDVKLSQFCGTSSHFKHVQNIMHLRSLAEVGESNYIPGLVYVVPGSILVWRYICTTVVVLNMLINTDSWQLLLCLKAHNPGSREQELLWCFLSEVPTCTCPAEPSSRASAQTWGPGLDGFQYHLIKAPKACLQHCLLHFEHQHYC